jgi:putative hydrolase of the HAD superfamily
MTDNKIQYIYFDLGGVVLDFKGGFARLAPVVDRPQEAIENAYFAHAEPAARGTISAPEFWARIRQDLKLNHDNGEFDYEGHRTDSFAPISETHQLMRELSANYRIGILSNTESGVYEHALRKGHIPDIAYANVIKSCEVGMVKPEKEIYQLAQDHAGVSGLAILFVDDRAENIEAAESFGWHGVLFDSTRPADAVAQIREKLSV